MRRWACAGPGAGGRAGIFSLGGDSGALQGADDDNAVMIAHAWACGTAGFTPLRPGLECPRHGGQFGRGGFESRPDGRSSRFQPCRRYGPPNTPSTSASSSAVRCQSAAVALAGDLLRAGRPGDHRADRRMRQQPGVRQVAQRVAALGSAQAGQPLDRSHSWRRSLLLHRTGCSRRASRPARPRPARTCR